MPNTLGVLAVGEIVNKPELEALVLRMRSINPNWEYFAFTLPVSAEGNLAWSSPSTRWVGWVEEKPGREIREVSPVIADNMAQLLRSLGHDFLVVDDEVALSVFLRFGGNLLMSKNVVEARFEEWLEPREVAFDGAVGFLRKPLNVFDCDRCGHVRILNFPLP